MKWGAASVVLTILLSILLVDEWREKLFPEESGEKSVGRENRSERSLDAGHDRRTVKELLALMRSYENQWHAAGHDLRSFPEKRWEVVRSWPLADVELLCRKEEGYGWLDALFERWGMEAPEAAIAFVLGLEKKYAKEFMQAKTGLEGGPGEAEVEVVGLSLNAVLAGWARTDPRAAWQAVSDPRNLMGQSQAFEGYGYLAPIEIFAELSKMDPDFAFHEFQNHENPNFQGSMLKGMARGLPSGTDWAELMRDILSTNHSDHRDVVAVMRGGLLGRWMAENPREAESWFRGDEGIAISRKVEETVEKQWPDPFQSDEYVEVVREVEVTEISLASAVRHWAASDMDGATAWLKDRRALVPEILKGENWLDPDPIGAKECREILVSCFSVEEREALVTSYLSGEEISVALDQLIESYEKTPMRKEILELQVSDEIGEIIFQRLWSSRNWAEDDSAPGGDPDPFANE